MPQHDALETIRQALAHERITAMHGDTPSIRIDAMLKIRRLTIQLRRLEGTGVPQS
jgi:hypothetical protein